MLKKWPKPRLMTVPFFIFQKVSLETCESWHAVEVYGISLIHVSLDVLNGLETVPYLINYRNVLISPQ